MNTQSTRKLGTITFQFNGQITTNTDCLKILLAELRAENPPVYLPTSEGLPEKPKLPEKVENNNRLAYTMRETAEILGVHYITVHRLIQRGLLKNSKALRKIIIPAMEIERFLKETL
jgi:hypothetical protein